MTFISLSYATPVVTQCILQKNYLISKFLMKLMIDWTHYNVYIPSSFTFLGENIVEQKSLLRVGCRYSCLEEFDHF